MYFVIRQDSNGTYRALAYGGNNEIVWWTEQYRYKSSAQNAIDILKAGAYSARVIDRA